MAIQREEELHRLGLEHLLVAEVLVGLPTDTTVYLSRRGGALTVNKLTFNIRASDSSWHPGPPGRPLLQREEELHRLGLEHMCVRGVPRSSESDPHLGPSIGPYA